VINIAIGDKRLSGRLMTLAQKIAGFRLGAVIDQVEPAPDRRHGKMVVLDPDERRE